MLKSNVIVGSNVRTSKTEDPRMDKEFIGNIRDYEKLKQILKEKEVNREIPALTFDQEKIVTNELRCIYAKSDPCFGYVEQLHKVVCKCMNGNCPKIKECNPEYTDIYSLEWEMSDEERQSYGDPSKLRKYYLTDLVSEEERNSYESTPENAGRNFMTPFYSVYDEDMNDIEDKEETKINPLTGRLEYVVGYRWEITDNASYEQEELVPIWGTIEEYLERKNIQRKKTKIIQKKPEAKTKKFELTIIHIEDLLKIARDIMPVNIILDNPAERAIISSILMEHEIEHGFDKSSKVRLVLKDESVENQKSRIGVISNKILKQQVPAQEEYELDFLLGYNKLYELDYAGRNYYNFKYKSGKNRWCCRNVYEVIQICIEESDIQEVKVKPNATIPVYLQADEDSYSIINDQTGEMIGKMNEQIPELLNCLKEEYLIDEIPDVIDGIYFKINDYGINVFGIGQL